MSLEKLKSRIKANKLSGIFVLYGQEEYTKDHYARLIRGAFDGADFPVFNHVVLDMSSTTLSEFNEACEALPFMAERKLIELKELNIASMNDADAQLFSDILKDLPPYVCLLIVYRADDAGACVFDVKEKLRSASAATAAYIVGNGVCCEFDRAKPEELIGWLARHFKAQGVEAGRDVLTQMVDMCGTDMYVLHSEVNKLCCACREKGRADVSDVKNICCANESFAVYNLSDLIVSRSFGKAEHVLNTLLQSKIQPVQIIATLAKRFSELYTVKAALVSGVPVSQAASALHIGDWVARRYSAAVAKTDLKYLSFVSEQIFNADVRMKSSAEDKEIVLRLLIAKIAAYNG